MRLSSPSADETASRYFLLYDSNATRSKGLVARQILLN